tara:strand:+ start:609 stop:899 length:291 start_codon:yes stop_codon:yes gene_type:complete
MINGMGMGAVPPVQIVTTNNRGHTPEELASLCADKIISVADSATPEVRDQARAFRHSLERFIAHYMKQAIRSDRTTVYNAIRDAGHDKLAEYIRRL